MERVLIQSDPMCVGGWGGVGWGGVGGSGRRYWERSSEDLALSILFCRRPEQSALGRKTLEKKSQGRPLEV